MPVTKERVESGIPGLDKLIEGGFVKNAINLIAGQTGTGKTLFCMQYLLHGLRNGENGVYVSLEQKIEDIMEDVAKFGWKNELQKYVNERKLSIISEIPTDFKELGNKSLYQIKKVNAKRFVLDSLSIASVGWKISTVDIGKVRSEVFDYMRMLKNANVTSLLITEIPEADVKALSRFGFEEFLADGVVIMHYIEYAAGGTPRSLLIRKMRRTDHGTDIYPLQFTKQGLRVSTPKKGIVI